MVRVVPALRTATIVLTGMALSAACQSSEGKARAAFSARLKLETSLTPTEIHEFFEYIAPAIAGKTLNVRQGAVSRVLDERQRLEVLGILSDPAAVYDGGLKTVGMARWRGLTAGATPAQSEIDAMQTLWIDVDTFVPQRYEFAYSMPGFGDYQYDLSFSP